VNEGRGSKATPGPEMGLPERARTTRKGQTNERTRSQSTITVTSARGSPPARSPHAALAGASIEPRHAPSRRRHREHAAHIVSQHAPPDLVPPWVTRTCSTDPHVPPKQPHAPSRTTKSVPSRGRATAQSTVLRAILRRRSAKLLLLLVELLLCCSPRKRNHGKNIHTTLQTDPSSPPTRGTSHTPPGICYDGLSTGTRPPPRVTPTPSARVTR